MLYNASPVTLVESNKIDTSERGEDAMCEEDAGGHTDGVCMNAGMTDAHSTVHV